jgi:hypothetical protein
MRRLLWLAAGLVLLATGLWLAGRPPSAYVLEKECERFQQGRRERYTLLQFHIARADLEARPDLQMRVEEVLRETKRIEIRGWEVILVPAGARAPGGEFKRAARFDPPDPPPFEYADAWIAPRSWLARLFAGA